MAHAPKAHILQSFVCPVCRQPVIAFRWTFWRREVTLVNCLGTPCPGASSLVAEAWCVAVGIDALPAPLVLG